MDVKAASAPVAVIAASPPPAPATAPAGEAAFSSQSAPAALAPVQSHVDGEASRRPGLGTEWGESRRSPSFDVDFDRADDANPTLVTRVRYDDERGVAALASTAGPGAQQETVTRLDAGGVSLWLRDTDRSPLRMVQARGETFVVGDAGERYTIVLENHTGHRIEAVATVDGLDVINGKPGSLHNRGYVIRPYDRLEIDGFRQSESTVAAFRFGRVGDSYAAKTGSARDVGVIGVAVFGERGDPWSTPAEEEEARRRAHANPFPGDSRYAQPPGR
jgi:hypothetical protein